MTKYLLAASLCAAAVLAPFASTPAMARQRTVVEQLPADIVDKSYVDQVEIIVADTAARKMAEMDQSASAKRAQAGLAPLEGYSDALPRDQYATAPFSAMAPLVLRDVTRKWGLHPERGGKAINLRITVENIKTANAAMAMLLSSSDELSGEVVVLDPATQQQLGSFYVQVVNSHGGLAGLAMRGGGVREKLVEEFALESSRILTGSTKKDWKKRVKATEQAEEKRAEANGSIDAGA